MNDSVDDYLKDMLSNGDELFVPGLISDIVNNLSSIRGALVFIDWELEQTGTDLNLEHIAELSALAQKQVDRVQRILAAASRYDQLRRGTS